MVTLDRRRRNQRPQGHVGDSRRRTDGNPDPAEPGACRQCLVEVEGQRKPLASCTTVATDDMVVRTQLT